MAECRYMHGESLPFKTKAEADKLIGKRVVYLRHYDIDKSGRGYIFPKRDKVIGTFGRNIEFEYAGFIHRTSIAEITLDTRQEKTDD